MPKNLIAPYQTHLLAATGYYNHLLFRLQYEFQLQLKSAVDCFYQRYSSSSGKLIIALHFCSFFYWINELLIHATELDAGICDYDEKAINWAGKACHRCLVYLGDLGNT